MKTKTCERGGCDRPQKAHGLCQRHYDRERSRSHRPREDRVLPTRARNRAVAELIRRHKTEFDALYDAALAAVTAEAAELAKVAKAQGAEPTGDRQVLRLKRGPAAEDEELVDRIDASPACEFCATYHDDEHRCLHCEALPSRAIDDGSGFNPILVPAEMTDERIAAAVAKGRAAPALEIEEEDEEVAETTVAAAEPPPVSRRTPLEQRLDVLAEQLRRGVPVDTAIRTAKLRPEYVERHPAVRALIESFGRRRGRRVKAS